MKVFQFVSLLALCSVLYLAGCVSNSAPPGNNTVVNNVEPPKQSNSDTVKDMYEDYQINPIDADSKYGGKTLIFESYVGYILAHTTYSGLFPEYATVGFCYRNPIVPCKGVDAQALFPNPSELSGLKPGDKIKFEGTVERGAGGKPLIIIENSRRL